MRKLYKLKQLTFISLTLFLLSIFITPTIANAAVTSYISNEVGGNNQIGRDESDNLDNVWMTDVGSLYTCNSTNSTHISRNAINPTLDASNLLTSNGVTVSVSLQNVTDNKIGVANGTNFSAMASTTTLQDSSPMPSSIVSSGYYANETGGSNSSRNGALFTFSSPVKAFGAWFGDLESRTTDMYGSVRAYVRYFDSDMNQIGSDFEVTNTIDESLCGSVDVTNAATGCGNKTTRWIGFVADDSTLVKYMLVVVGDDDTTNPASLYKVTDITTTNGNTESISFVGPTLVTNNGCSNSSSTNSVASSSLSTVSSISSSAVSMASSSVSPSVTSNSSASSTVSSSNTISNNSSTTSLSSTATVSSISSSTDSMTSKQDGDVMQITNINNGTINNTIINGGINTTNNYNCGCNSANCNSSSSACSCNSSNSSNNSAVSSSVSSINTTVSSSSYSSLASSIISSQQSTSSSNSSSLSLSSSSTNSSLTSSSVNSSSLVSSSSSQACANSSGCGSTVTNITYNINYGTINYTTINGGVNNIYNYFACGGICSSSSSTSNSTQSTNSSNNSSQLSLSSSKVSSLSTASSLSISTLSNSTSSSSQSVSSSSNLTTSSVSTTTSNLSSSQTSSVNSSGSVLGTETASSNSSSQAVCLSTNLHLVKYHTGNFTVGQNGNFTLSLSNYGPNVAKAPLTINDTLPVGMQLVSYNGANWNCSSVGQNVTCTKNTDMATNENSQIVMTVSVSNQALSKSTNVASVYFACGENDPVDNTASDTVITTSPSVIGAQNGSVLGLATTGANYLYFVIPGLLFVGSTLLIIKKGYKLII